MNIEDYIKKYESSEPVTSWNIGDTSVQFAVPNQMVLWRVQTMQTKEPETFDWILGLGADDVLVDVGANIGLYTVLAAKVRGVKVYSFEPDSQNYALLVKNIMLNGLGAQATAYCAAVTDKFMLDKLYMPEFAIGGSCNQFGQDVDMNLTPTKNMFSQGCIGVSLDEAVASGSIEQPTHIKVDVDGFEHLVVAGAAKVFSSPRVRSALVEVNVSIPAHREIHDRMKAYGFTYDQTQMQESSHARFGHPNHFNVIFSRS